MRLHLDGYIEEQPQIQIRIFREGSNPRGNEAQNHRISLKGKFNEVAPRRVHRGTTSNTGS